MRHAYWMAADKETFVGEEDGVIRRQAKARGLEPDECYKHGKLEEDGVPDIAIEVIVSRALVSGGSVGA